MKLDVVSGQITASEVTRKKLSAVIKRRLHLRQATSILSAAVYNHTAFAKLSNHRQGCQYLPGAPPEWLYLALLVGSMPFSGTLVQPACDQMPELEYSTSKTIQPLQRHQLPVAPTPVNRQSQRVQVVFTDVVSTQVHFQT